VIVARRREQDRLGLGAERLGDAGQQDVAMISAPVEPPGSRVSTTLSPSALRRCASVAAWVDLPLPSPPSKVMKCPRKRASLSRVIARACGRWRS